MKKNSISTAILASLAGIAGIANISSAVNINPDGTGQALVYPYYTSNGGNQTLLSVVNTTNTGKAVKVRFLEGRNSREVLDFNLFLSAQDVWTAAVINLGGVDAPASILTLDTSCTSPNFSDGRDGTTASGIPYVNFRNTLFTQDGDGFNGPSRTREGHLEMIEMATLIGPLNTAITHDKDVPADCKKVLGRSAANALLTGAANVQPPSGGLFGGAAVINIANGTYTNYNATALDAFWDAQGSTGITDPDSLFPSLSSAAPKSLVFSNGRIISSTWGNQPVGEPADPGQRIDAVSAVFMADTFFNEYSTIASNNESSEWVITFPTKRFYVDRNPISNPQNPGEGVIKPFTSLYDGQACETISISAWNREEFAGSGAPIGFSPPAPGGASPKLCFETNILTFNQAIANDAFGTSTPSKIFGSVHARNINTPSIAGVAGNNTKAGWARIGFGTRQARPSVEGHKFVGLPVAGFWAISIENNNATPGVKGFYGGAFNHRNSRACVGDAVGSICVTP